MKIVFLDRDTMSTRTVVRAPAFDHVLEVFDRTTAARLADAPAGQFLASLVPPS